MDFKLFCQTRIECHRPATGEQRAAIAAVRTAAETGLSCAAALKRGFGKTTYSKLAVAWLTESGMSPDRILAIGRTSAWAQHFRRQCPDGVRCVAAHQSFRGLHPRPAFVVIDDPMGDPGLWAQILMNIDELKATSVMLADQVTVSLLHDAKWNKVSVVPWVYGSPNPPTDWMDGCVVHSRNTTGVTWRDVLALQSPEIEERVYEPVCTCPAVDMLRDGWKCVCVAHAKKTGADS